MIDSFAVSCAFTEAGHVNGDDRSSTYAERYHYHKTGINEQTETFEERPSREVLHFCHYLGLCLLLLFLFVNLNVKSFVYIVI